MADKPTPKKSSFTEARSRKSKGARKQTSQQRSNAKMYFGGGTGGGGGGKIPFTGQF